MNNFQVLAPSNKHGKSFYDWLEFVEYR